MVRTGDDDKVRTREQAEFKSVNYMREKLNMPLLEKGWVKCVSDCGDEFFTFDKKGNRMCDECKAKPREKAYHDFDDAYCVTGI